MFIPLGFGEFALKLYCKGPKLIPTFLDCGADKKGTRISTQTVYNFICILCFYVITATSEHRTFITKPEPFHPTYIAEYINKYLAADEWRPAVFFPHELRPENI